MPSPENKLPEIGTLNTPVFLIPTEIWLSLATGPFLLGMLGVQTLNQWLQSASIASEEVLRGDRLPVLHFPKPQQSDTP